DRARRAEAEQREIADGERKKAERSAEQAHQQRARAEAGERDATEQRKRADQNLYHAQMHLALQAWREPPRVPHPHDLLARSPARRGWEWFYLNSLPYQTVRTLTESGGSNRASAVAWHVASKRLAEGTADGLIRIWDVDREQTTLILRAPAPVLSVWGARW